jgi:hypothetical protein
VPDDCRLGSFDPLQIAWAAGFFDGEGSTRAYRPNRGSRFLRLQATVPQKVAQAKGTLETFRGQFD